MFKGADSLVSRIHGVPAVMAGASTFIRRVTADGPNVEGYKSTTT
jgi:hypothetical protein